jgi:hypothetical protein
MFTIYPMYKNRHIEKFIRSIRHIKLINMNRRLFWMHLEVHEVVQNAAHIHHYHHVLHVKAQAHREVQECHEAHQIDQHDQEVVIEVHEVVQGTVHVHHDHHVPHVSHTVVQSYSQSYKLCPTV